MADQKEQPEINLAAPSKEEMRRLAGMSDGVRRALIEAGIMKRFAGQSHKVTLQDTKARVLKMNLDDGYRDETSL